MMVIQSKIVLTEKVHDRRQTQYRFNPTPHLQNAHSNLLGLLTLIAAHALSFGDMISSEKAPYQSATTMGRHFIWQHREY